MTTENDIDIEYSSLDLKIESFCQSVSELLTKIHDRCGDAEGLESLQKKLIHQAK